MRIALFQPDIPQNTGTILRLAACLDLPVDIIEPAGFPTSDRAFRRAGMDYLDAVSIQRHATWARFEAWRQAVGLRLVLATTQGSVNHVEARFEPGDIVLMGRESAGVPAEVHAAADLRVRIPMAPGLRSLNVAVATAMIVGEALRQANAFPKTPAGAVSEDLP